MLAPERSWRYELTEIDRVASELIRQLGTRRVVALRGDLGAGKTTLTQAIVRALGSSALVTSPTFSLEQVYHTQAGPVHHFDFYRIEGPRDVQALALDEVWASGDWCLMEWPERVAEWLPQEAVVVELATPASESALWREMRLYSAYF
jgi:tRNA threonylcarbamoyladenosine biosynthesis protein TsaE